MLTRKFSFKMIPQKSESFIKNLAFYFHNLTKFISGCRKTGYDIIFNIDGSASIGEDDFEKIKR